MACRALFTPRPARAIALKPARRNVMVKAEDAVAGPYAKGLIDLAQEQNILDNVYSDLMGLQAMIALPEVLDNSQDAPRNDLRDFLVGVPLQGEQRKEVIDTLGKEVNMRQETINFLKLLVDTNRLDCIDDIITVFEERYNTLTDTQIVTLKSAARLQQDQEFEIAKHLQEKTNSKNIKIKPIIDPTLIGGFVVEFGDNMVDLSVKGQLDRIEGELMAAAGAV